MPRRILMLSLGLAAFPVLACAQVGLPGVGNRLQQGLDGTLGQLDQGLDNAADSLSQAARSSTDLVRRRLQRLDDLVRRNPQAIERDAQGNPARKGEILLVAPDADTLAQARKLGFAVSREDRLAALDLSVTRLALPPGMSLARAQDLLTKALPQATIAPDTLHFSAGSSAAPDRPTPIAPAPGLPQITGPVGVIDNAPGPAAQTEAVQGFAPGAPAAGDHGSAMAWLLHRAGVRRVLAADVYGTSPAGGNALALAQGLDWLVGRGVRVVSISLVGPANPLVARAVGAAQQRGAVIVAAVGNDGPAAPPAFPASYPGVLAVTAVDGRNRALIEAGRAAHLDYAAPGADMRAMNAAGRLVPVRGTSYAVPLVAARVANAQAQGARLPAALDREAIDLGPRGPDKLYGRGLLCTICR